MSETAAMKRLQASAARNLRRMGGTRVFREYAPVKDWEAGSEAWGPVGATVTAASQWTTTSVLRADGDSKVRATIRVLHVERPAFGTRELTADWKFTEDGVEHRIGQAVLSDDETYWVVTTDSAGAVLEGA